MARQRLPQRHPKGSILLALYLCCHNGVPSTEAFHVVNNRGSNLFAYDRTASVPHGFHYHARTVSSYATTTDLVPTTTDLVPTKRAVRRGFVDLRQSPSNEDESINSLGDTATDDDPLFSWRSILAIVGSQSLLILVAAVVARIVSIPNYGLGQGFLLDGTSLRSGFLFTLPLFGLAYVLDLVEDSVPRLKDVTRATQRSVLALMGGKRKPLTALFISVFMGTAAGFGEEMLFRGILQEKLVQGGLGETLALGSSALVFGALHAVTPLYAGLAFVASVFFGVVYLATGNLAVPVVCHGLYDVGALMWAHYVVTAMTTEEQMEIVTWVGPNEGPLEE